jgi:hypothetical protein
MHLSHQLAKHLRDVFFGGNWTSVNLRQSLEGVGWQQATTKVHGLNPIAALVFHIGYYVQAVLDVASGTALTASDKFSFDLPAMGSEDNWIDLQQRTFASAEALAAALEKLDDRQLPETFADPKYGSWLRNILGLIEHTHYHLGQIVVVRKMLDA